MSKENSKGPTETLGFRVPIKERDEFLQNMAKRGWRKDDVLREVVQSINALFKASKKPERPLMVIDAMDRVDARPTEPSKTDIQELRAFMASQLEKNMDEIRALHGQKKTALGSRGGSKKRTLVTAVMNPQTAESQRTSLSREAQTP